MVAIETWNGHVGEFSVPIVNYTEVPANAILRLSASPGIDLELDSSVGVHEAQLDDGEWMLLVEPIDGDIFIAVHPQDDILPGFYSITGQIVQIAG
jgi:hypothetical protein